MQLTTSQRALVGRLADGQFHSGAGLARELAVSRTSVWALVHDLAGLGLDVKALPGKGYRLVRPLELLDRELILSELDERARADLSILELHDCIDSTSTRLGALAREDAPNGSVCIAEVQTCGRGRVGRVWFSPFAGNICFSMLWYFSEPSAVEGLSLAVGVATMRVLRRFGITDAGLKWPNDILWRDRKLGGILLEVSGEAHGRRAVVIGVGLNMYIPPQAAREIDQSWTDLWEMTGGAPPSRNRLVAGMLNELFALLEEYPKAGLRAYLDEWNEYHCMRGRAVVLHQGDRSVRGRVVGVNAHGLLILQVNGGEERAFASGDVRVRLDES
ncbi:MAG: biotin--[acetyl-CoA-carboxylase] ligase [Proteobacteria bacterium]|nr:biotin--[acetyl-CoA-carboxylase] ligase [Pseudomonadota bacterium]